MTRVVGRGSETSGNSEDPVGGEAPPSDTSSTRVSLFDAVGGSDFFVDVVDHFYDHVVENEVLRPLYPEDLGDSRRYTALFLIQYWGGPGTYSEERGHPRLRMRHLPFVIGQAERDAWYQLMMNGIDHTLAAAPEGSILKHPTEGADISAAARAMFNDYFEQASTAMINQPA